jgi:hypothetical protein
MRTAVGWGLVPLVTAAFVLAATSAGAAGNGEVLYLSESHGDGTTLYSVGLDWVSGRANLDPLTVIPFEYAKAIACTPDGARIYAIDQYTTRADLGMGGLGYFEVASGSWQEVGYVTDGPDLVPGIVLAAFAPDGTLLVASEETESLYTVNVWTGEATLVGQIVEQSSGATVNVLGADIAFGVDGTLYLWTNGQRAGAQSGLYELALPAVGGVVYAEYIGGIANTFFTGLALRANGYGDLVGSENEHDQIVVISKANGTVVDTYDMYVGEERYDYRFGDMTVGPLALATRTIGYYKNHSWGGATVTVCGVEIDETLGKRILGNARGNNFSMLFAQLIAAKLNTFNATGIPVIDEAEAWLCSQGVVIRDSEGKPCLDWGKAFTSKQQKSAAGWYSGALDYFNNLYDYD